MRGALTAAVSGTACTARLRAQFEIGEQRLGGGFELLRRLIGVAGDLRPEPLDEVDAHRLRLAQAGQQTGLFGKLETIGAASGGAWRLRLAPRRAIKLCSRARAVRYRRNGTN